MQVQPSRCHLRIQGDCRRGRRRKRRTDRDAVVQL